MKTLNRASVPCSPLPPERSVTPEWHLRTGRQSPLASPGESKNHDLNPSFPKHIPSLMNSSSSARPADPHALPEKPPDGPDPLGARILHQEPCAPTLSLSRVHNQPQAFNPRPAAASLPREFSRPLPGTSASLKFTPEPGSAFTGLRLHTAWFAKSRC